VDEFIRRATLRAGLGMIPEFGSAELLLFFVGLPVHGTAPCRNEDASRGETEKGVGR
jgi:hypothetical protein